VTLLAHRWAVCLIILELAAALMDAYRATLLTRQEVIRTSTVFFSAPVPAEHWLTPGQRMALLSGDGSGAYKEGPMRSAGAFFAERNTGLEPATSTLARLRSTS
jgi:hypothetical protein